MIDQPYRMRYNPQDGLHYGMPIDDLDVAMRVTNDIGTKYGQAFEFVGMIYHQITTVTQLVREQRIMRKSSNVEMVYQPVFRQLAPIEPVDDDTTIPVESDETKMIVLDPATLDQMIRDREVPDALIGDVMRTNDAAKRGRKLYQHAQRERTELDAFLDGLKPTDFGEIDNDGPTKD